MHRAAAPTLVLVAILACGGPAPTPRTPGSSRSPAGLDALAAWLHDELTSGDPARIRGIMLRDEDLDYLFDATTRLVLGEQLRAERRHIESTAGRWGRFAGSQHRGFCARGAGVVEPGRRGLRRRAEAVDEILVVGWYAGSEWAGWVREIMRGSGGFRLVKLPTDQPRARHPDLDLWACEVARRPGDPTPSSPSPM